MTRFLRLSGKCYSILGESETSCDEPEFCRKSLRREGGERQGRKGEGGEIDR